MVSRLFGSDPFDILVDRATSEYLPPGQPDLALNLDISDQIRGKTVAARPALGSIRRRISDKNPVVQLHALTLADTCVKNGGNHFVLEVASRDFMDFLTQLVRQQSGTTNEVRAKILALLQSWALSFRTRRDLSYVCDVYDQMKRERFPFPSEDEASGAPIMIDTAIPPDWIDGQNCNRCRTQFTFTNRKHHCRNCGQIFCQSCSSYNVPLPQLGITRNVRVCTGCYNQLQKGSSTISNGASKSVSFSPLPVNSAGRHPADYDSEDDEDLKRAIQMSIEESKRLARSPAKVAPRTPAPVVLASSRKQDEADEETDPDLAAAIRASLDQMQLEESKRSAIREASISSAANRSRRHDAYDYDSDEDQDINAVEAENILLFSTLVDRVKERGTLVTQDRQLKSLSDQISRLRPKLIKGLEESARKHRAYVELHEKLSASLQLFSAMEQAEREHEQMQKAALYAVRAHQYPMEPSTYNSAAEYSMAPNQPAAYPAYFPRVAGTEPQGVIGPTLYPGAYASQPSNGIYYQNPSAGPAQQAPAGALVAASVATSAMHPQYAAPQPSAPARTSSVSSNSLYYYPQQQIQQSQQAVYSSQPFVQPQASQQYPHLTVSSAQQAPALRAQPPAQVSTQMQGQMHQPPAEPIQATAAAQQYQTVPLPPSYPAISSVIPQQPLPAMDNQQPLDFRQTLATVAQQIQVQGQAGYGHNQAAQQPQSPFVGAEAGSHYDFMNPVQPQQSTPQPAPVQHTNYQSQVPSDSALGKSSGLQQQGAQAQHDQMATPPPPMQPTQPTYAQSPPAAAAIQHTNSGPAAVNAATSDSYSQSVTDHRMTHRQSMSYHHPSQITLQPNPAAQTINTLMFPSVPTGPAASSEPIGPNREQPKALIEL